MDKKNFEPKTQTIKKLFIDVSYSVPDYQRFYSWTDDEIDKLWDDLEEAYTNNKNRDDTENYFLGSVITVASKYRGREDIVDGQQRMTTLTLLLAVFCHLYNSVRIVEEYGDDAVEFKDIKDLYLKQRENIQEPKLKLQAQDNVNTDFQNYMIHGLAKDLEDKQFKKPTAKEVQSGKPIYKYKNAVYKFKKHFDEFKGDKDEFINYILNDVIVIKVECNDLPFAIKLFQIINDRGLDLTTGDIVKSYLLSCYDPKTNKDEYEEVKGYWASTQTLTLDLHTSDMSNYINYYVHYLLESAPKTSVASLVEKILQFAGKKEELEKLVAKSSVNQVMSAVDFASNLYNFVNYFSQIYQQQNKIVYAITMLPWDTVWVPLLSCISASTYTKEEKEKLLKTLQRYLYINYIAGNGYNQIKQTSFNAIALLKAKAEVQTIIDNFEKEIKSELLTLFKTNLLSDDAFYKKWIKNVLVLIEYNITDTNNKIIVDKEMHIEHIMPVKWHTNERHEWDHMKDYADKYLYSLGNLTLLNYKKNIFAQNEGFDTKIKIYSGEDERVKKDSSAQGSTQYQITKMLVDNYKKGKKVWGKDEIEERAAYLESKLLDVLEIDQSLIFDKKD